MARVAEVTLVIMEDGVEVVFVLHCCLEHLMSRSGNCVQDRRIVGNGNGR